MIEFALIISLFLIFLFGIMDWAWVFFQHQVIMWRASDAARWVAANRFDTTVVNNIMMCADPNCGGVDDTGFFRGATISAELVPATDVIDSLPTVVTRYYVQVQVTGYQVTHFTPFFSNSYTANPITATQPMECQDAGGNCQNWN
jgi:Flp pilus assembly protein TadG